MEQAGVGLGVNLGRFGGVRSIYIGNGKILGDFGIWALESSDLLLIYKHRIVDLVGSELVAGRMSTSEASDSATLWM